MRIRHEDGFLAVDFNDRGANYEKVVGCTIEQFKDIEYSIELMMATELHNLIEVIKDNGVFDVA